MTCPESSLGSCHVVVRGRANKERKGRDLVPTVTVQVSMWVTDEVSIHQGCTRTAMGLPMGGDQGLKRGWALTRPEEKVGVGGPERGSSGLEPGGARDIRVHEAGKHREGDGRQCQVPDCLAQVYGPRSAGVASEAEF